eukprot:SAG31_NODE_1687_length_7529_cov_2.104172_5_plen_94_part_00
MPLLGDLIYLVLAVVILVAVLIIIMVYRNFCASSKAVGPAGYDYDPGYGPDPAASQGPPQPEYFPNYDIPQQPYGQQPYGQQPYGQAYGQQWQ